MTESIRPLLMDDDVLEAIQAIRRRWCSDEIRLAMFRRLKFYTEQYHLNPGCDGTGVLTDVQSCIDELEIKEKYNGRFA